MVRVTWTQSALDRLATIWTEVDSASREAITVAVNQIDRLLGTDPQALGESREGHRRTLFVAPLGIDFHLEPDEREVVVLRVWLVKKRKS